MRHWLAFLLCEGIVLWILLAGLRTLLRRPAPPRRRGEVPATPAREGLGALSRLLAATKGSAYSRDRVQDRLQLLAGDLEGLRRAPGQASQDPLLAAYFAEDHVGFKGHAGRQAAPEGAFLDRTEEVLGRLERLRKGDPP